MNTLFNRAARGERGFSLVELMVGMAIGLIGITIITHLYLTNEKYKRSTQGSGTANVNGALALYVIERDVRASGYGINHSALLACTCTGAGCSPLRYHYDGVYSYPPAAGPTSRPSLMPAPVVITSTNGTPDSITVLSSSDNEAAVPITLTADATAGGVLKIDGVSNYREAAGTTWTEPNGYFLLIAQAGSCAMSRATRFTQSSTTLERSGSSRWNPSASSTLPTFAAGAYVFNLGFAPAWRTYSIVTASNAYKLQVVDVMRLIDTGTSAQVQIVDDVVDMQAEYGRDVNNNGTVEDNEWFAASPTTAAEWMQVQAVRIGILARSGNYERPDPPGSACNATTATPEWAGSWVPGTVPPKTTAKPESTFTIPGGLPSCYKHRVFETVVPLRNMIWRQS